MNPNVIIIGAGGAGMMCAIHAARRGRDVLLLDHSKKLGGKILISGGGRCNFTNMGASPANYVSQNPHFIKSALSRYPAENFIQMVRDHDIAFHEKKLGQLFCDESAQQIVDLLKSECDQAGARFQIDTQILSVRKSREEKEKPFFIETSAGSYSCDSLVIATGGFSIPKIGATGFGYRIAHQFGLKLVETVPALDGFTFDDGATASLRKLAGISADCIIRCNGVSFRENILFTHSGMSGPASLQASLHWSQGDEVEINLLPEMSETQIFDWFVTQKRGGNRSIVKNLLAEFLTARFADLFCELYFPSTLPLPQISEKELSLLCAKLHAWRFIPAGTVGYSKAEVTRGGVDTDEISSKTLEAKKVPGLYFIGEVVDVTGWLGGYNFQWAWASGWAAAQVV